MSRARFFLSAAGLLLLTGMVHNQLVKSEPGSGAALRVSPTEVKLWFKERPEVALTSVTLMRADTTRITTIRAVATDDTLAVAAPLSSPLPAGEYLVAWRTASNDGHVIRGMFGFTISP